MKEYTLVVMAAGMGSRFGGLKQITPVDEEGNFIIDYSVYDAKKAGFNQVVFVIKEEHQKEFEETIGKRIKEKLKVSYAYQKLSDIPSKMDYTKKRVKPWGTVQAILCTRPYVKGPFVIINADDFYGYDAFKESIAFLKEQNKPFRYACISYPFGVTKSDEGAVKRGVLKLMKDQIEDIIESSIQVTDNKVIASPLDGRESFEIQMNAHVSMNMFAFQNDIYGFLEEYFQNFFKQSEEEILKNEALLPECLEENIKKGRITIVSQEAKSKWLGMTYKSDLEKVKKTLRKLKDNKEYPSHLWE